MSIRKLGLLLLSGFGLVSVANYSAQVAYIRDRKKVFGGKPFWVIAHRGFSGRFPENTMLAFEEAAKLPIDCIELDVHSSRDGKVVIIHDPTLERTTNRMGRVFDFAWEDLKKLDAGYHFDPQATGEFPFRGKGCAIPLLEDVFKTFPDMKFIIEIKQTLPAIEELVYRLIRKYKMQDKVIVASEHHEPLIRFRHIDPSIATNLAKTEARDYYQKFRMHLINFHQPAGDALQIPERYNGKPVVTPLFVASAKRKGLFIHIWTVNNPKDMRRLIEYGVDGIISDHPDRLLQVVASLPSER